MVAISPTISSQVWGPERWQRFAYYAHPTRDGGGNPCFVFRHGGGGWQGSWLAPSNGSIEWPMLYRFLRGQGDAHFDVISIQTCEQFISGVNQATYRRTTRHNMWDNIIDHKRGICAVKAWGTGALTGQTTHRIDPDKIISGGDSFGATVSALSMITPPIEHPTRWVNGSTRPLWASQFDSTVNGVWFHRGQVDFRKRLLPNPVALSLLDYLDWGAVGGIWGTRDNPGAGDTSAEWDAVPTNFKESVSLLAYIENGYTDFYRPMFITYPDDPTLLGTYPLIDNHDPRMQTDLVNALIAAKLDFQTSKSPIGPPEGGQNYSIDQTSQDRVYEWASALVRKRPSRVGAVR